MRYALHRGGLASDVLCWRTLLPSASKKPLALRPGGVGRKGIRALTSASFAKRSVLSVKLVALGLSNAGQCPKWRRCTPAHEPLTRYITYPSHAMPCTTGTLCHVPLIHYATWHINARAPPPKWTLVLSIFALTTPTYLARRMLIIQKVRPCCGEFRVRWCMYKLNSIGER